MNETQATFDVRAIAQTCDRFIASLDRLFDEEPPQFGFWNELMADAKAIQTAGLAWGVTRQAEEDTEAETKDDSEVWQDFLDEDRGESLLSSAEHLKVFWNPLPDDEHGELSYLIYDLKELAVLVGKEAVSRTGEQAAAPVQTPDANWPTVTQAADKAGVTVADISGACRGPLKYNGMRGPNRRIDPKSLKQWMETRELKARATLNSGKSVPKKSASPVATTGKNVSFAQCHSCSETVASTTTKCPKCGCQTFDKL